MKIAKFFISLILLGVLVFSPIFSVFAAPTLKSEFITGTVQRITLKTDPNTAVMTVVVTVQDGTGKFQDVQLSIDAASDPTLGLVTIDGQGNPVINEDALGMEIEIDPTIIISSETQNPVASALATFFDLDYDTIMDAHEAGTGFGVITQALWLTQKIAGEDATAEDIQAIFLLIIDAKNQGTYQDFFDAYVTDATTIPSNWGQFRKALLASIDDKKINLGAIMSQNDDATSNNTHANNGNKDKHKSNNGHNGQGNANGNNNHP